MGKYLAQSSHQWGRGAGPASRMLGQLTSQGRPYSLGGVEKGWGGERERNWRRGRGNWDRHK